MSMVLIAISVLLYGGTIFAGLMSATAKKSSDEKALEIIGQRYSCFDDEQIKNKEAEEMKAAFDRWCFSSGMVKYTFSLMFNSYDEDLFKKYFVANSGLFIGRLINPGAIAMFSSLLSMGSMFSLIMAAVNAYYDNYGIAAIGVVVFVYYTFISRIQMWFPYFKDESVCIKRSILNFRMAFPSAFNSVQDEKTFLEFYIKGRNLGFAYYDSLLDEIK